MEKQNTDSVSGKEWGAKVLLAAFSALAERNAASLCKNKGGEDQ